MLVHRVQTSATYRSAAPAGVVVLGLLAAACARPEMAQSIAFSEADHRAHIGKGTATIRGEGFLRRPNAWLARCSGEFVFLMPATAYYRERLEIFRKGNLGGTRQDRQQADAKALRKTQCDMQGKFVFSDLPAGKWLLFTRISYDGNDWNEDSVLTAEVETRVGEVARPILSNPNRIQ